MPFDPSPQAVYDWSFYTYGYHVDSFFRHILSKRGNDFEEFLLHHIAAICLFFGFIMANGMCLGGMIAWLHDIADILASVIKVSTSTHFEKINPPIFFSMMTVWFVTRLVWLPYFLIQISFNPKITFPPHLIHFNPYITFTLIFLLAM